MLAFVNARGDHRFVGVLDLGSGGSGKQVRYLDPSVDRDSEPVWSRDGKQLAFIRRPTSREAFAFGPKRTGEPWAIRIANMQSGTSREIWKADEGQGSVFRNVVSDDQVAGGSHSQPFKSDSVPFLHIPHACPAQNNSYSDKSQK